MQEERLYNLITSKELTWEGLIRDIVTSEGLDPWNIDISLLVSRYLQAIRDLKQNDIRISGKFILAVAILLKMKSDYLLPLPKEKITEKEAMYLGDTSGYELEPHVPLPKKRKVTLDELLSSLRQAMVVKGRREIRRRERDDVEIKIKVKRVDITKKIRDLYSKTVNFFGNLGVSEIKFSDLVPSKHRWDIIWTFIPLVHLANKGKLKLRQEEDFGEIYVRRYDREETKSSS